MTRRFTAALMAAFIVAVGAGTAACLKAADVQTPKGAAGATNPNACPGAEAETASSQPATPTEAPTFTFGKSDGLTIGVDPELTTVPTGICSKAYVIGADGKINFCQLGAVTIEGKTEREVEEFLKAEFRKREFYVAPFPQVNVQATSVKSQTVFLNGEIRTPGSTQIEKPNEMTLMHALAAAGNPTPQAGPNIYVLRSSRPRAEGEAQPLALDDTTAQKFKYARKWLMDNFVDPPIQAGDTIWVEAAKNYIINGEVKSGGIKIWEPCITVGDAIAAASGMTDKGSLGRSHISRKNAKGAFDKIKGLKLETMLQPKDELVIGRKLF